LPGFELPTQVSLLLQARFELQTYPGTCYITRHGKVSRKESPDLVSKMDGEEGEDGAYEAAIIRLDHKAGVGGV
jgi:hypothetical protein